MREAWALFDETLKRAERGDWAGAKKTAAAFRRAGPRGAAAALDGFLFAVKGDSKRALSFLNKASRLSPREAWILDWLAQAQEGAGDGPSARKTLLKGLKTEAAAPRMLALSRVCERLGLVDEARQWAQKSCAASSSYEAHAWLASLWAHQRQFDKSAQEYARAIALSPSDLGLRLARSQSLALGGKLSAALAAAPSGDDALGMWRGQLEGLLGRRLTSATPFTRGYALLARKKWAAAAKSFAKVSGPYQRRGRFYLTAARMLEGAATDWTGLAMIGLGVDPPYSVTAEALKKLSGCDVVFNNIQGAEIAELLWPLCRDVRPAYSEAVDLTDLAGLVMREIRRGRRVGFVTRGSALIFGRLGNSLAVRCAAEGLPWTCLPALSTADLFEARVGGCANGAGVLSGDGDFSGARLDPGVPWTVFAPEPITPARFRALRLALVSQFGARRRALYFDHKVGDEPLVTTLGALGAFEGRLTRAPILRLPADGEVRFARKGEPLLLVGLGPEPREHATIEALEALGRMKAVRAEGFSPEDRRWLSAFCKMKGSGRPDAYATPHHPFRYDAEALKKAARGRSCVALPAVSAESAACAVAAIPLGAGVTAVQSFDARALSRGEVTPEPRWPCVVYDPRSAKILLSAIPKTTGSFL